MVYYLISALINAITSTVVGVIPILRNPKSRLNRSFSYFALSVAFWSYCYAAWQISKDAGSALFWCRALMAGAIFIPSTFFHFSVNLIEEEKRYLKVIVFGYIASLIFLILDFTPLFVKDVRPRLFFPFWPTAGAAFAAYLAMFAGLIGYSQILLYKRSRKLSSFKRNQIKYVFLGTSIGFLGGLTNFPLWYGIPIPPVGNILVAVYVFVVFYEMIKHRLMDINLVIKKAAVYGVIYGLVVGMFVVLVHFFGQLVFYKHIDRRFYLVSIFALTVISLLLKPLDNLLTRITDKIFFRRKYAYQKTLKEASDGMTKIRNLGKLLDLIVRMIANSVRVTHATIFLKDKEKPMFVAVASRGKYKIPKRYLANNASSPLVLELLKNKQPLVYDEVISRLKRESELSQDLRANLENIAKEMRDLNASVCLPSFIENKMIGFLMLGEKLSGDMYTQEDLDLFSTLANQAALAIENAQAYEELKDTRDQLIHSERLATIGRFANEVAHEIKNPLQAIKTFVEFLPQKYADKNFREKFTRIVGAEIERINTFVKQLAGFSRPKPLDFQPVDLNQVLDATLLLLENDFKKKGVLVKKKYSGNNIRLSADRDQLKQAFLNIFLNSLEAMEEGKSNQLIVEMSADNSRLNIKISDTGCGISKENLKHLFQPFFSTKGKGAGLGLAITKNIIENHKGRISVESELGRGTSFLISFPGLAAD